MTATYVGNAHIPLLMQAGSCHTGQHDEQVKEGGRFRVFEVILLRFTVDPPEPR
jgi:hypothetical protein